MMQDLNKLCGFKQKVTARDGDIFSYPSAQAHAQGKSTRELRTRMMIWHNTIKISTARAKKLLIANMQSIASHFKQRAQKTVRSTNTSGHGAPSIAQTTDRFFLGNLI